MFLFHKLHKIFIIRTFGDSRLLRKERRSLWTRLLFLLKWIRIFILCSLLFYLWHFKAFLLRMLYLSNIHWNNLIRKRKQRRSLFQRWLKPLRLHLLHRKILFTQAHTWFDSNTRLRLRVSRTSLFLSEMQHLYYRLWWVLRVESFRLDDFNWPALFTLRCVVVGEVAGGVTVINVSVELNV